MSPESYWLGHARRLALVHNFARWAEAFWPVALGVAVAAAAGELLLREMHLSTRWVWPGLEAGLAAAAGWALWRMSGHYFTTTRALVRLEEHGHLHNRLSAALAGVAGWPEPRKVRDPAQWRWGRVLAPACLAAFVLAASAIAPLSQQVAPSVPEEQPLAWSQLQSWLELLQKTRLADPSALEKLREQLGELQQQPADRWYKESSLEAGDSLRDQTQQALQSMQRDLQQAEKLLREAAMNSLPGSAPSPEQLQKMEGAFAQALEGLQTGNLPLNKELLKQLKELNPESLRQLSQQQLEDLQKQLQESKEVCRQCLNPGSQRGEGEGEGEEEKNGPGGGGETRPLTFRRQETKAHAHRTEQVASEDFSSALPAELLGISTGQHEVKKEEAGPAEGGAIAGVGAGGDAVWRTATLPKEKTALQRFFK